MTGIQQDMHTMTSHIGLVSSNVNRLGNVVATLVERPRPSSNGASTRRNHPGSSSSSSVPLQSGHRTQDDDVMDVDDGAMADDETPLPVPRKARTGPKLRGIPTKRDPERKALLVRLHFQLLKEATYLRVSMTGCNCCSLPEIYGS